MYKNYTRISNVGCSTALDAVESKNNPLTYCLNNTIDQRFSHGSSAITVDGQGSRACQLYLPDYCSNDWDEFCELASQNTNTWIPNSWGLTASPEEDFLKGLNAGQKLIYNTARRKYLRGMVNCVQYFEPFDPTVADSPLISFWDSETPGDGTICTPIFDISEQQAATLDQDPVMNKILDNPYIAIDLLTNIFHTKRREGTLLQLRGTRLGKFYENNYQKFGGLGGLNSPPVPPSQMQFIRRYRR
jgi:hypothetical protein